MTREMKLHVHLFHQDQDITAETETDVGARRSLVGNNVEAFADADADAEGYSY